MVIHFRLKIIFIALLIVFLSTMTGFRVCRDVFQARTCDECCCRVDLHLYCIEGIVNGPLTMNYYCYWQGGLQLRQCAGIGELVCGSPWFPDCYEVFAACYCEYD